MLQKGVKSADVAERLRLYQDIRYVRANKIQEFSRKAGRDLDEQAKLDSKQSGGCGMWRLGVFADDRKQ